MKKLLLVVLSFGSLFSVRSAVIEPGDSDKRHKTDYATRWNADSEQTYTVGASAYNCSFVDSKTKANGGAALISRSSSGATAEKQITHTATPTTSGFGFSVSRGIDGLRFRRRNYLERDLAARIFLVNASGKDRCGRNRCYCYCQWCADRIDLGYQR